MSFRNKRTGAFQPFGGIFGTEKTSTIYREAPDFVRNQTQSTMGLANRVAFQPIRPQVASFNEDQREFFNTARDYARSAMNREVPQIDVSSLEALQGRSADTSALQSMMNRGVDMGGVLGMVGRRVDPSDIREAMMLRTNTDELGNLMGQENVARDIFQDFTTREVTPYLETQVNAATDDALQNVSSLYANSGRLGSGAFGRAAAEGVTRASAPILQQAAQQDAARQLQAAGMLGQAFQADRAADIGLADRRAAFEANDFGRQLQGAGILANLEDAGLQRDMAAQQFAAQSRAQDLARQQAAAMGLANFSQSDLNRELAVAQGLTGASLNQARLAPTMQQMDMANMGLLAQIGSQQQAQQQAAYNAQLQYQQMLNDAQQQRFNNMVMASQLGEPYIGSATVGDQGMFNTLLGAGTTILGGADAGLFDFLGGFGGR